MDQYGLVPERFLEPPQEVDVRLAGRQDGYELAKLRQRWTEESDLAPADESFAERFTEWLDKESEGRKFWLAEVAEEPVGMVNLLTFERMPRPGASPSRWGYIGNMFVLPEWRGKGVAPRLLGAVIGDARSRRFERIVLSPSERSISFWLRAGFGVADELLVYRL